MDGLGLASVTVAVASAIAAALLVVWSTRKNIALTRENRVEERKIDAYLELLRIIEREGLWLESRAARFATPRNEYEDNRPKLAPEPPITDRATISALLSVFGSRQVRDEVERWRHLVTQTEEAAAALIWNWEQNAGPDDDADPEDVERVVKCQAAERLRRKELAVLIAAEVSRLPKE